MGLFERIQQAGDIPFKNESILDCGDLQQSPFVIETRFATISSVPVSKIIGSCHPSYCGMTWGDFMTKGERIERRLQQVDEAPDYYYASDKKEHIGFIKFPNGYFIEAGNHRSAIAKFLFFLDEKYNQYLHGVCVTEYIFDNDGERLVDELSIIIDACGYKEIISVTAKRMPGKQGVSGQLSNSFFYTELTVSNSKTNKTIIITNLQKNKNRKRVRKLIAAIDQRTWWTRWFSKNEFAKFVG